MIINKDYILSRFKILINEQSISLPGNENKKSISKKIHNFVWTHRKYLGLLRAIYKAYREVKLQNQRQTVFYNDIPDWMTVNFLEYCFTEDFYFNTSDFFPKEEDVYIQKHIDERIKSALRNYVSRKMDVQEKKHCLLNEKIKRNIQKVNDFYRLSYENKHYYLPQNYFETGIWIYHYGLKDLPDDVKSYIAGKDFLDIGAFMGDSSMILSEYNPNKIYAYEPVADNYKLLLQTVEKNKLNMVFPVNKGMGDIETVSKISGDYSSSSIMAAPENGQDIIVSTIDRECKGRNTGVIKMDIEGFEYQAIKGGLITIKRDRPVMLISVYHTGKDFFEIPSMLKRLVPEYKMKIVDTCPITLSEKILVAYI
jgi:FkbM family methyltransferase